MQLQIIQTLPLYPARDQHTAYHLRGHRLRIVYQYVQYRHTVYHRNLSFEVLTHVRSVLSNADRASPSLGILKIFRYKTWKWGTFDDYGRSWLRSGNTFFNYQFVNLSTLIVQVKEKPGWQQQLTITITKITRFLFFLCK